MTAIPPGADVPPPPEVLDPAAYRRHIGDTIQMAFELESRYRKRGDRYALASISLAFAAGAVGFLTAAIDAASLGAISGVLGAAGAGLAAWIQRNHLDDLAAGNRLLFRVLQREAREYDAHAGIYRDDEGLTPEDNYLGRFRAFVSRCEKASEDAQEAAQRSVGVAPQ